MIFYTILGSYVITSMILFKYPTLLHKKKKIKFRAQHISHRGGAGENYENTIVAFRRAREIGTDMLELDCHLSKDGEVVVAHDQHLLRSTGVDKTIGELNYKDLPLMKTRLPIDFSPGVKFVGSCNEEERKFPLLKDVFKEFPKVPINLDVKMNNDQLIDKVNHLIKEYDREEYTVWGNFNNEITAKCYEKNPNINLLFSMQRVLYLIFLMYTGLLPFVPLKETHLEIFLPTVYLRTYQILSPTVRIGIPEKYIPTIMRKRNNNKFLPMERFLLRVMNVFVLRPFLINHLKARGMHVYFWVLNNEKEYKQAYDLGATGVMTDYPTKLMVFLKSNNMRE